MRFLNTALYCKLPLLLSESSSDPSASFEVSERPLIGSGLEIPLPLAIDNFDSSSSRSFLN